MEYNRVISYADILEIYQYEISPKSIKRKVRVNEVSTGGTHLSDDGSDNIEQVQYQKVRSKENVRRSLLGFKRLVSANLSIFDRPLLITLTYAENFAEIGQGRKDFNTFARNLRYTFGKKVRYIAVAEFQKRGAIHFHTLVWGVPTVLARAERDTRLVAGLWGKGFVDIIETDGSQKLAGYLSKYFSKQLKDIRFFGKKTYITSRNIIKPIDEKHALLSPYFFNEFSTLRPLKDHSYMTQFFGKGRYRLFKVIQRPQYANLDYIAAGNHLKKRG